jgi:hypothetical protein
MKVNRPLGILYRFYLHLKDKFDPRPSVSEEEKHAVEITKKLVSLPESDLFFGPVSEKRIIRNEEKQVSILIDSRNISIINHVYSYSVYIESDDLYRSVIELFDTSVENRKEHIENEIKDNINKSLKKISENLKL